MKIKFLGTGAADWEDVAGERKKCSALVNDTLLIDIPIDILSAPVDLSKIKNVLITHTHSDHFSTEALKKLADANVYCSEKAAKKICIENSRLKIIEPFSAFECEDATITPLEANHYVGETGENALHYIIEKNGKTLFYGLDGAWIRTESWIEMKKHSFDLMVFDGTFGDIQGDERMFEHNTCAMLAEIFKAVRENGLLSETGKIVLSHFSKYSHYSGDDFLQIVHTLDAFAAYDGLEILL